MSPRVGMIVALVAAALLALSAAGLSWWSGHPTLDGKEFHRKTAHIGLIRATQCNYDDVKGEDYECKELTVGGSLAITKFAQLGLTGIAALLLIGLAFAGGRRNGVAKVVLVAVAASSVMAVVVVVMGPNLKTGKSEAMPFGAGIILFAIGTIAGFVSAVLAILPPRRPRPVQPHPATSMQMQQMMHPTMTSGMHPSASGQQPAFDVQALLAEDTLRPAALGPEPLIGMAQSPGGMLPGPAGPLGASGPQPLFQSAPQLRPLYEQAGASGGFVPPPTPVQFPTRGPTPMPQAAVNAFLENEPPAAPAAPPPTPRGPPPPNRTKPLSAAPPIPAIPTIPSPAAKPKVPPKPTITSAAVPPPSATPASDTGDSTSPSLVPFDETATREFQSSDDMETNAVEKVDPADAGRASKTEVEVDKDKEDKPSAAVISSAAPPPSSRKTPVPMPAPGTKVPTGKLNVPITTAPSSLPPPAEASPMGGPSPACPQCESPMVWVEEHLRFYCKSCRMYF